MNLQLKILKSRYISVLIKINPEVTLCVKIQRNRAFLPIFRKIYGSCRRASPLFYVQSGNVTKALEPMSKRPVHVYIKELSQVLVGISDKVVGNLYHALRTVKDQDLISARQIKQVDNEIDREEVDLEDRCLEFLALQHPVARDLRTIVTIIKVNDDLERIGDLALHIIDRMHDITPEMFDSFGLETMGRQAGGMVAKSIEAFILKDRDLAYQVCALDDEIDAMHQSVADKVKELIKNQDDCVDQLIPALSISRYIERIADHDSKIAQEVIYLVTGEIIRHKNTKDNPPTQC